MQDIRIRSSSDGNEQPALGYVPRAASRQAVPLVVGLHPWSFHYTNHWAKAYHRQCRRLGWALICPDYRGPNDRPEACGSDLAVQDVLDAVDHMRDRTNIDDRRIYLLGVSGGGYMALLMAGREPGLWAAVSAWVPIMDLAAWHGQSRQRGQGYADMLEAVCGGAPEDGRSVLAQYRRRSPKHWLHRAGGLAVEVQAGIDDGHDGNSVPISHTLEAFNMLAQANGRADRCIQPEQIRTMTEHRRVPPRMAARRQKEPPHSHAILFRRQAGPARVRIFEGGHEIDVPAAFAFLQTRRRPGSTHR